MPIVVPKPPPLPEYSPEDFEMMAAFRRKMALAVERCLHIAESEKYFGCQDSSRTYTFMAQEMAELPSWLATVHAPVDELNYSL